MRNGRSRVARSALLDELLREAAQRLTCVALPDASAPEIDARLQRERLAAGAEAAEVSRDGIGRLPDGAMFASVDTAYAVKGGKALPWSFAGYGQPGELQEFEDFGLQLLTPLTTVEVLRAGYRPVWHATAA